MDLDPPLHQLRQIVAEKVGGDVVVLVRDYVVQDQPDGSYLVALECSLDGVRYDVALPRALPRGANLCKLLVAVEEGVVGPKEGLILRLEQLLDRLVVESEYRDHILPVKL